MNKYDCELNPELYYGIDLIPLFPILSDSNEV